MIDEHQIPGNFVVAGFDIVSVDHTISKKEEVVADSRRKPQQYESLAQPFKKDRRFRHSRAGDAWVTTEVNP